MTSSIKNLIGLQGVRTRQTNRRAGNAFANINVCETLTCLYKQVIFDLMVLKCDERSFGLRF